MESGSYGLCEICGRAISPARLFANPRVSVCLGCQIVRERTTQKKEAPSDVFYLEPVNKE